MKFASRFAKGDKVWVDCSAGYHSLVQYNAIDIRDGIKQQMTFHDGQVLIGVSLLHTPIYESNFSVEKVRGKNVFYVGHLMGHIGCSAWATEQVGGKRVTAATEAEGLYYANKAYLTRLNGVIKGKQNKAKDKDNLTPSQLMGLQSDINKLIELKKSIEKQLKTIPLISRKKTFRRESRWNIGDTLWTIEMGDHIFGECGSGKGDWHSCADRYSGSDLEVFDTVYKILTGKPFSFKVESIRTWDCQGPDFLYKAKGVECYGNEHHQHLCFATQLEAEQFVKEFVFVNRKKVSRQTVLIKYRGILETLLIGELTPKQRREIESIKKKFNELT